MLLRDEEPADAAPIVKPLARDLLATAFDSRRYQVLGELARGGMGLILKSRDGDLGRDVAMKVLRDEHAHDSGMIRRFVEEAQIAGQLQHPGILPVYELGVEGKGTPYFTMKLVKGRTLAAVLRDRDNADDDRMHLLGVFSQVCQTLAYAHAKGVIHRDLKPSNILVGSYGEVQVVDWGLAKVLRQGGIADDPADASAIETVRTEEGAEHSLAGSVMGTPAYMSPEQARGEVELLDERCDVFALGAILTEILTGRALLEGARAEILEKCRAGDLSAAHARLDDAAVDPSLRKIIDRALAPKVGDRLRDAGVMAQQISGYLDSVAERARAAEIAAERADARALEERRARRLTRLLAAVLVTAVGLGSAAGWWWFEDQNERDRAALAARRQETAELSEQVATAREQLAAALADPIGEETTWERLRLTLASLQKLLASEKLEPEGRQAAETLISRVERAERDRRMATAIEDAVILGATHNDRKSWLWMEEQLREAFSEYGIDLLADSNEAVAKKILASDLAGSLADGLELWIATCAQLSSMGATILPFPELFSKVDILYRADPHPLAGEIRKLFYAPVVPAEQVRALTVDLDFAGTRPRTLAWLGNLCYRAGDHDLLRSVFLDALHEYPDDFMLNFDFAYSLEVMGDHEGAVRYAMRCLMIRPKTAGIWRFLGNAERELGDFEASRRDLERSIELQPDHVATHLDLGKTHEAREDAEAAIAAFTTAIELDPTDETARAALLRLQKQEEESSQ